MILTQHQIDFLRALDATAWATLIDQAVDQWLVTDRVDTAFGPLSSAIDHAPDGDIAVSLARFYRSLDAHPNLKPSQVAFRDGLRRTVGMAAARWPGYKRFEALLGVVRELGTGDSNEQMLQAAQSTGFMLLPQQEREQLYGLIVGVLRDQPLTNSKTRISEGSLSAAEALVGMCQISDFPSDLVYMTFALLARAAPAGLTDHLELLEKPLQRLRLQGKEFPAEWLQVLREYSALFPPSRQIKREGFGWANEWLFPTGGDEEAEESQSHIFGRLARVGRATLGVVQKVKRRGSTTTQDATELRTTPPEAWRPPSRQSEPEYDAETT